MTIYQKELLKQLPKLNCTGQIDVESGMLHISTDGLAICIAGKKADIYWNQDKPVTQEHRETVDALCGVARTIREYVSLYEFAPPLNIADLPEYEELLNVPYEQQITSYFGDYSLHHFRYGVTDEQICLVYQKTLAAMKMSDEEFRAQSDRFSYRSENIGRMRDCLLSNELRIGEKVLFVATEPYRGNRSFELRGGIVLGVDTEQKTCEVRGDFFTMEDVPLRYVLGRYDTHATGKHYGYEKVQPLFGEYPVLAQRYLKEVEDAYHMKRNVEQEQDKKSTPVSSI